MHLLNLAGKNVLRKMSRSLITAVPVLVGALATILGWSFVDGVDQAIVLGQIESDSGHFRVLAGGYLDREDEGGLDHLIDPEPVRALLRSHLERGQEARLHPRLSFRAELSNGRDSLVARGVGVEPETYFADFVLPLEPTSATAGGDDELQPMWLGVGLAADFDVGPGDSLVVFTRTRFGSYTADELRIEGLVHSRNPAIDNLSFFLPLTAARTLLDAPGTATEVVGLLPHRDLALGLPPRLGPAMAEHDLVLQSWRQRAEPILHLNRIRRKSLAILVGIIVLVAAVGIANTVVMAGFERVREIGTLRALGLQTEGLVLLFLIEALMIGVAGAAAGCAAGIAVVHFLRDGLDLSSAIASVGYTVSMTTKLYFVLAARQVVVAFGLGVGTTAVAALFAVLRFSRLTPMEAMRR